ncbi:uncharacterized protein LOC116341409 [Contarinia nasturtii]|uniref:uncharacterized protein LOC116341409 n=1 Tax=Contarinia nasturtii TaxID=265458 RepID=UPI0012D4BACE|nr:uncharacterized protein LOC116341409 [Contarinia nasturtii]
MEKNVPERNISSRKVFELVFNILNHISIVTVAIHATYYCYLMYMSGKLRTQYHMHVWFCTIGYQLLMAESILTLYSNNYWSLIFTPKTKRNVHWILQVVGSAMAIFGSVIFYLVRKFHFMRLHSILGLISLILVVISGFNGISALWSYEIFKKYRIRPVILKIFHNFIGISAFVVGMASLYYGHDYQYFGRLDGTDIDFSPWLQAIVILTTTLSLTGAVIAFYGQFKSITGL